jgi:hypothetical protein
MRHQQQQYRACSNVPAFLATSDQALDMQPACIASPAHPAALLL